jgi:hypothetical protein
MSAPIMADVMPTIYHAFQAGKKVIRYFSDPIKMKREADPRNEITKDTKMLTIILDIRIFLRRFLNSASDSCRYSFRMFFISLNNALIISFKEGN